MDRETVTNSIFIFISSFVFGILVSSFVSISLYVGILFLLVSVSILLLQKEVLFISLIFLSFGLGTIRYQIKDAHELLVPSEIGIVVSEPEQRENSTRFVFKSENGEKVLVNTDLYSPVQYGDGVRVEGKLKVPGIIEDEITGREFDYAKFLAKDDIYHTMSFTKVEILSSGHGNSVKEALLKLKDSLTGNMKEILAEPESSLLAGLLLAGKAAMPKDILDEFQRAGVIHIVVLSGYNITIISDFIKNIFRSNIFSIVGIVLFVIMTGAQATVVRAALMVLAVVLAKMFHRKFSAPRALTAAAFLMLIQNPKILVFDPSFQLSFLATSALIFVSPIFERHLKWVTDWWGIRTTLATTLATQIVVLPYLIYNMGNFSLVSILANMLILLIIPATMLLGFIATLVAYVSTMVALPLSYATHLLLTWILGVSHYLSSFSFASVRIDSVPWWFVCIIYILMIIVVKRVQDSPQRSANLD